MNKTMLVGVIAIATGVATLVKDIKLSSKEIDLAIEKEQLEEKINNMRIVKKRDLEELEKVRKEKELLKVANNSLVEGDKTGILACMLNLQRDVSEIKSKI